MVVYYDSQMVASHVNSNYECMGERMKKYLEQVKNQVNNLQAKFVRILREENKPVDHLAKVALAKLMIIPSQVLSFIQISPLIDDINV